jgi:hypothetical protein
MGSRAGCSSHRHAGEGDPSTANRIFSSSMVADAADGRSLLPAHQRSSEKLPRPVVQITSLPPWGDTCRDPLLHKAQHPKPHSVVRTPPPRDQPEGGHGGTPLPPLSLTRIVGYTARCDNPRGQVQDLIPCLATWMASSGTPVPPVSPGSLSGDPMLLSSLPQYEYYKHVPRAESNP